MNAELEARIGAAVEKTWAAFTREHPSLARVIDQTSLRQKIAKDLENDADFIRTYQAAVEANVGAKVLASFVEQFVAPALRRLM